MQRRGEQSMGRVPDVAGKPAFAARLERWGAATALIDTDGRTVSYRELAELADRFAAQLPPGVRLLAIEAANAVPPLAAYLGALRAGIPVILHGDGAAAANLLSQCPPDAAYVREPDGWRLAPAPQPWEAEPHPDLAVLLSTSGSTGSARLVRLSGANLDANADAIAEYLGLDGDERAITTLHPSYSFGLSILNSHLGVGASIVLTEWSVRDEAFRALMTRHGVTSLSGVPYSFELMERCGLLASLPPSVRTLTQAGGRMAPGMVKKVCAQAAHTGARLFVMYGQTEATARMAYLPPEHLARHPDCIGRAIPGGRLWIETADGVAAKPGEEGELVYCGPNVMMGYATARRDLAAPPGSDVLRTGDQAVEAAPGVLRITGRASRFVKPFGLRVSLDELEQRCRNQGAPVFVAGDDALIVVAAENTGHLAAARTAIAGLGLDQSLFEFLPVAPVVLLPNGKPDYRALLAHGHAARNQAQTHGLETVTAIFQRLARGQPLAERDSFESLGGDSLNYVQCSFAIEEALGRLPDKWEHMTLAQLRALSQTARPARGWLRPVTMESDILVRCGAILLVLFQHAVGGVQGGADILMMLAGFTWAHFQSRRLIDGKGASAFLDFARRYLIIYLLIVCGVSAQNDAMSWGHLAFVSTFLADWGGILNIYWFIESLAWCVAFVCLAFALPPVRRAARSQPLQTALGFVGLAAAIRLAGAMLIDTSATVFRTPDQMLLYFACGWAIALAGKPLQLGLFVLLCAASGLAWGWTDTHLLSMACAGALMVFVPRIALPAPLARTVMLVAAAGFYIYLFNIFPLYLTDQILREPLGRFWLLQLALSLVLGLIVYVTLERGQTILAKMRGVWRVRA